MTRAIRIRLALVAFTAAALVAVLLRAPVEGQSPASHRPPGADYSGQAFTFNKISDDVYHAVGTGALTVMCNASIVINANDVLVVDSHVSPAGAWALREELKAITPKPIRFVVNSHFHFDHSHGNQIYGPDVEIIGHDFTRAQIVAGASKTRPSYGTFIGVIPGQIDQVKQRIAAATDPAERGKLDTQLAVLQRHKIATDAVIPTPPTMTLNQSMTIHRGGREIRLLFLGRGHTGGDVVTFLPKERVVMTGDLLVAATSYLGDAFFTEWVETIERLKGLEFDTVLPGHGAAFKGKDKLTHWQAYVRDFWTQAQQMHKAGLSAQEAAKRMDMRAHAANYPNITAAGVNVDGVLRAYEVLDGKVR